MDNLANSIRELVALHAIPPVSVQSIADDTNLVTDLGMDSLEMMTLILAIEERLGVHLSGDFFDSANFSTFQLLIQAVTTDLENGEKYNVK